jgi:DNA-binding MarR family transcriptional regulator
MAKLTTALETFHSNREGASIQLLLVFLAIAQRKTISAAQIGAEVGLSQSAVSRSVTTLGRGKAGETGLGLVVQEIDPIETRAHAIKLTAKGKALAKQLAGCLEGAAMNPPDKEVRDHAGAASEAFAGAHWEVWVD